MLEVPRMTSMNKQNLIPCYFSKGENPVSRENLNFPKEPRRRQRMKIASTSTTTERVKWRNVLKSTLQPQLVVSRISIHTK